MMNPGAADAVVDARYCCRPASRSPEPTRSPSTAACVCTSIRRIRASPRRASPSRSPPPTASASSPSERCSGLAPAAADWDEASASLGLTSPRPGGGSPQVKSAVRVTPGRISRSRTRRRPLASVAVTLLFETAELTGRSFASARRPGSPLTSAASFHPRPTSDSAAVVEAVDGTGIPSELIVEWSMYSDGSSVGSNAGWSASATPLEPSTAEAQRPVPTAHQGSRPGVVMTSLAAQAPASQAGSFNIKVVTDASPDLSDMASLIRKHHLAVADDGSESLVALLLEPHPQAPDRADNPAWIRRDRSDPQSGRLRLHHVQHDLRHQPVALRGARSRASGTGTSAITPCRRSSTTASST